MLPSMDGSIRVGGADVVGVDIVIPRWEIVEQALQGHPENLKRASDLHDTMEAIVTRNGEYIPGHKYSGTDEDYNKLKDLYTEYKEAINPSGLETLFVGTTVANKLHYLKVVAENKINTVLFSAVSDDNAGIKIKEHLKKDGTLLADNGEILEKTRINFAIIPKGSKDRVINKFPFKSPKFFYNLEKQIANATSCDIYLLEASQVQYFKSPDDFKKFLGALKNAGTKLVFAPPTDEKFFIKEGRLLKDNIECFIAASEQAAVITMNESEAIWFSGRPRFRGEVKRKDDEHLVKALEKYQEVLDKYPDKTLVVTAGAVGAFIIRKDFDTFTPGIDIKQIVNKAGAGDCAAAMAIYELLINNKTITPDVVNDAADLLVRGCTIKIQCPDTQVDMSLMRDLLKGKTPTQGVVDIVVPKQVEKQRA